MNEGKANSEIKSWALRGSHPVQCWPHHGESADLIALNHSSAGPDYIQDPHLVNTVSADGLAPDGARPYAGTVMTTNIVLKYLYLLMISNMYFVLRPYELKRPWDLGEISWGSES